MKLIEEQRKLIEENHNLIYGFLKKNELDEEEYYDIAAIGLCKAAMQYNSTKGEFSTFAYKCMKNKISHQWSYDARKRRIPKDLIYSYNTSYDKEKQEWRNSEAMYTIWNKNGRDTADIFIEEEKISKFLSLLKEEEQLIVKYLVSGFIHREIANKIGVTEQAVSQRVRYIRRKWNEYNEKGYIVKKKRGRKKLK